MRSTAQPMETFVKCKTVFIVEDDSSIRETLQQVIEYLGFKVVTANNGQEGLEKLATIERPCLILLDLMMPVMDGWQFLQAKREQDIITTIPVVIVSAYFHARNNQLPEGVKSIIKKPVNIDMLIEQVTEYCKND